MSGATDAARPLVAASAVLRTGVARVRWAHASTVIDTAAVWDAVGTVQRARFDALQARAAERTDVRQGEMGDRIDARRDAAAQFAVGRALIVDLVRELAGADADATLDHACDRCGGPHGTPRLRSGKVVVSVSYTADLVVVAAVRCRDAPAIGIDIETAQSRRPMAELAALFAPHPTPDVAGWTRIEAVLKADGRGLRVPPAEVRFTAGVDADDDGREPCVDHRQPDAGCGAPMAEGNESVAPLGGLPDRGGAPLGALPDPSDAALASRHRDTARWTATVPGNPTTYAVETMRGPHQTWLSIAVPSDAGSPR